MKKVTISLGAIVLLLLAHAAVGQQLWGNTLAGGSDNIGVVFKANPDGTGYSVVYQFVTTTTFKGSEPQGQPMRASDGKYYGLATYGGVNDKGVLYVYDPAVGNLQPLHDFGSVANDGIYPAGSLTQA